MELHIYNTLIYYTIHGIIIFWESSSISYKPGEPYCGHNGKSKYYYYYSYFELPFHIFFSSPSQKCTDAESIQNESETITELPSKAFTLVNNEETQSAMPSDKSTSSTLRHQATSILRSTTRISTRNTWSPTFPKTPVIENKSSNCVTDKSTPVTTKNSVVASKNSLQDKVTPLVKETVLSGTILSTKRNSLGTITTTDIKIFPTSGSTATNNGFPTSSSNVEKDAGDRYFFYHFGNFNLLWLCFGTDRTIIY